MGAFGFLVLCRNWGYHKLQDVQKFCWQDLEFAPILNNLYLCVQNQMMQEAGSHPNTHSYSSSSVMQYSSGGGEGSEPRMYQATTSTRQAPGGVSAINYSVFSSGFVSPVILASGCLTGFQEEKRNCECLFTT